MPPHNDVDVYANDLGFVAIAEQGQLHGFNVTVGGGMGMTHGDERTFPRLADELGYIKPEDTLKVAEAVVTTQRDFGDRTDRKQARLKYTIEKMGIDAFRKEVETRSGVTFEPHRPVEFTQLGDRFGWVKGVEGKWHLTLYVENGRLKDMPGAPLMTGVKEIAEIHQGDFRMTANQNLIIANVPESEKARIDAMAREYGLLKDDVSALRENAMACVSLPTCTLAMAEAERYLPDLLGKFEQLQHKHGVAEQPIVVRMTGCPNGCARPYLAEIGMVGKGPGKYNLYLGADGKGTRLNKMYRENIGEQEILDALDPLLGRYAKERNDGEGFGDFVVRVGEIKAVNAGREFHD